MAIRMATNKKTRYLNAHPGCPGGPKCHHCTWDSLHINVCVAHAKYIRGHRGQYRGDIDGAIDNFLATLKVETRRLLGNAPKRRQYFDSFI